MVTAKQRAAARRNIKKAQARWKGMSHRERTRARKSPGQGGGEFYRIEVRPSTEFVTFRTHDVGETGHLERVVGQRASGTWETATWLVAKEDAHPQGNTLVIDNAKVRRSLERLGGRIRHKQGDVYTAKPRRQ